MRVGAVHDFGQGFTGAKFKWRLSVQFNVAPTAVNEPVQIYLSTGATILTNVYQDGEPGLIDAAGDVNMITNMLQLGTLLTTSTVVDHTMTVSGIVRIYDRYVSPAICNSSSQALRNENGYGFFSLTPLIEMAT